MTATAEGSLGLILGQARYPGTIQPIVTHTDLSEDSSSVAFRVYAGGPLSANLSLNVGLLSLGSFTTQYETPGKTVLVETAPGVFTPETEPGDKVREVESIRGFMSEARWQWRPGEAWRPYAKLGLAILTVESRTHITPGKPSSTGSSGGSSAAPLVGKTTRTSVVPAPGIGIVYETLQHWGVELTAERHLGVRSVQDNREDLTNIGIGIYAYW